MSRKINIRRFRRLAEHANRCVWMTADEATILLGSTAEGRFVEHASPQRILQMLNELEALRARLDALESEAAV